MEVFNTSKEAGPLWSHTREACQSPEEAGTLSAAGQRAGGAEPAGASLCSGPPSGCTHVKPTHTSSHRPSIETHAKPQTPTNSPKNEKGLI